MHGASKINGAFLAVVAVVAFMFDACLINLKLNLHFLTGFSVLIGVFPFEVASKTIDTFC